MKPYPAYKDSGLHWLGPIPQHWDTRPLKRAASVSLSNVDKLSLEGQTEVLLCNYTDVYYNDRITNAIQFMKATAPPDQISKFRLHVGDVLITKDSETPDDIAVPAVVSEELENVLCGYHLALLRPGDAVMGAFLKYALGSAPVRHHFRISANGVTRFGLSRDDIVTAVIPVPSPGEQAAIVAYLDRKNEEIDRFITKKRQLITLLNEQKAAIINQAVTRGLDPNVPMKPSGLEWLGEIPTHWELLPLKRLVATKITDGPHETPELLDEGIDFVSAESMQGGRIVFEKRRGFISRDLHELYCRKCRPQRHDIFMCKSGATTGKIAYVDTDREFSVWSPLALIRALHTRATAPFLFLVLQSSYVQKQVQTTWSYGTQPNISMAAIERLVVAFPNLPEQHRIVSFCQDETGTVESVISRTEREIELMNEYRTTLISDVVTGKIDVRETRH